MVVSYLGGVLMGLRLMRGRMACSKSLTSPLSRCQRRARPLLTAAGRVPASFASPQLPLAEQQATAAVRAEEVMHWYAIQTQAVQQTGDTLAHADGPSAADLQVFPPPVSAHAEAQQLTSASNTSDDAAGGA